MHTHRKCSGNMYLLTHLLVIFWLLFNAASCYSVKSHILNTNALAYMCTKHNCQKRYVPGKRYQSNFCFTLSVSFIFLITTLILWITLLLQQSGDIHPNPGPSSVSSDTSLTSTASILSAVDFSKHLSFVHYNVQSVFHKLAVSFAELCGLDILAFSETWLNDNVSDNDLFLQHYHSPERKDRPGDKDGGGLMIYVRHNLHYTRRMDLEPQGIECMWIELTLNHKHVLFGLFYRPPSSKAAYLTTIENSIHLATDTGIQNILITGDFNFNMLNARPASKINDLCQQYSLKQTIDEPTHFFDDTPSLLDLILTSNSDHLLYTGVGDPFLTQQVRFHCPIYGICNFTKPKHKSFFRHTWSFERGDYNSLREKASRTNWDTLYDTDITKYAENISNHIIAIAKECIPNRKTRIKPDEPSWINMEIKRFIRKRKRAFKKAKTTNSHNHWAKFKQLRNRVIHLIRESKQSPKVKVADKLKNGSLYSKDWWRTLKSVIAPNSKNSVPPLIKDGTIADDETDKANILNDFFRDQTLIDDNGVDLPQFESYDVLSELNSIHITPDEVKTVLKSLPLGKAAGPDGINNRVLRELAIELSVPFCSLFNRSLQIGAFPENWKRSHVTPIAKGGERSSPSNYRPISLLCTPEKCFERVVFKHIYTHFHENHILTSLQSGFIPGDSTVNQLTFLYNTFSQALDTEKEVRVVFCDVSKAFDRVWHEGLLLKLEAAGIRGSLLSWFRSYLSDRKQRVVLPGAESKWNEIRAGVPQGSILGPLLFLLFINDIVKDIGCNIRLFADDTRLFLVVEKVQVGKDQEKAQSEKDPRSKNRGGKKPN